MAEITSYIIVNGEVSDQKPFERVVKTQKEIEQYREELRKEHDYKVGDYNIMFSLKLNQSEVGKFHT